VTGVHPVLRDRTAGEGRQVTQAGAGRGFGHDHGGIAQGAVGAQGVNGLHHRRALLADHHVQAAHVLVALADDGVQCKCALAGAVVSNQQLALAAADRNQGVDDLAAGVERAVDEVTCNDGRRVAFNRSPPAAVRRGATVERRTQGVDDSAEQAVAGRHGENVAGLPCLATRHECRRGGQQNGADTVCGEVENQRLAAVRDPDDPVHACRRQAFDPHHAITDRTDLAALHNAQARAVVGAVCCRGRIKMLSTHGGPLNGKTPARRQGLRQASRGRCQRAAPTAWMDRSVSSSAGCARGHR